MTVMRFDTILQMLARPYERRMLGAATDAREALALADLYIRITYTLVVAETRRPGGARLRVRATPGVGSMLAVIRGAERWTADSRESWSRRDVRKIASTLVRTIDEFRFAPRYNSFTSLRNSLSHGEALPAEDNAADAIAASLRTLRDDLSEAVGQTLRESTLEVESGTVRLSKPSSGDPLVLTPLWAANDGDSSIPVGIFSHFGSGTIYYLVPGRNLITVCGDSATAFANGFLMDRRADGNELAAFAADVVRDVAAFTEDYSAPSYSFGDEGEGGDLFVPWTRSTSEQNQPRVDVFRVGPDNQYQWRAADVTTWGPYSSFLREAANWPLLARRIGIGLEKAARDLADEEARRFGVAQVDDTRGPARLVEVSEDLQPSIAYNFSV